MSIESAENSEKRHVKRWKGHKIVGGLLAVIGFSWLARKAGWMAHDANWMPHHATDGISLPLVLIACGLLLIFGLIRRGRKHS